MKRDVIKPNILNYVARERSTSMTEMPKNNKQQKQTDKFYEKLKETTEKYLENNMVLMGDFNVQVGARAAGEAHIIGKYERGRNKSKKSYLSEKTLKLIEDRRNLLSSKDKKANQKEISNLINQIRESMRKDRRKRRIDTLENHINRTGGTRKALKELREKGKEWIPMLKDKEQHISFRNGIQNIATNYYRMLYSNQIKTQLLHRELTQKKEMTKNTEVIPEILISVKLVKLKKL
ncbi:unnamed protein product [Euphydryas editha]|uniref:Endonuclease-reverse transcriptase n=1 Tax=Euphydryas editha TaxID=104508 RepID=A0AAU9U9N7_EUPED|nr:unnamed protein product [Euphydryas editha]